MKEKENEKKTLLRSSDDLIAAVEQYGFLPFFRNEIHGFSIKELCPPEWQMSLRQAFQQEGWLCEPRVDTGLRKLPA